MQYIFVLKKGILNNCSIILAVWYLSKILDTLMISSIFWWILGGGGRGGPNFYYICIFTYLKIDNKNPSIIETVNIIM